MGSDKVLRRPVEITTDMTTKPRMGAYSPCSGDPTLTTVFFDAIYLPEPSAGPASVAVVLTLLGLRRRLARSLRPG